MNRFQLDRDGNIHFIDGSVRCQKCKNILLKLTEVSGIAAMMATDSRGKNRNKETFWFGNEEARIRCCGRINLIKLETKNGNICLKVETFRPEESLLG